jgi:hypothetical protein
MSVILVEAFLGQYPGGGRQQLLAGALAAALEAIGGAHGGG